MFDILFGWRKASKCKNLLRHVQCRLKFLKIKRESIIRQLRDDIAQLLKSGNIENAFTRVDELFQYQNLRAAYDLLDHFSEVIIIHFPYLRKHKDCPNNISEAVSSLIYAAARCGDLPELQKIQHLFRERYGRKFAKAAVELHPGTSVNCQITEKLSNKSIPENVKLRLLHEILKDYGLQPGRLRFDNGLKHLPNMGGTITCQGEEQCAPAECLNEAKTIHTMLSGRNSSESCHSKQLSTVSLEHKVEMGSTAPTSESLFQVEKTTFNFEEVLELQFSSLQDPCGEEKKVFLFNSFIYSLGGPYGFEIDAASFLFLSSHSYGENDNHRPGSWNETACLESQRCKSYLSSALSVKDGQNCEEFLKFSKNEKFICHQFGHGGMHYSFPRNEKVRSPQQRHYTKITQEYMGCDEMQVQTPSSKCKYKHSKLHRRSRFSNGMDFNCSLKYPCYYSVTKFHNDILIRKCRMFEEAKVSDYSTNNASIKGSCSVGSSPLMEQEIEEHPSCSRTMTMFPENLNSAASDLNLVSASSQFQNLRSNESPSPSHVHPKLPDYNELVAKFQALKKEYQQRISAAARV